MRSTTISVEGNRQFVDAFNTLARKKNKTMGALVREAINQVYGDELQPLLVLFAASSVAHTQHSVDESNASKEAPNAA